ncbi:hypothetical protein ACPA54_02725 [Uniformispora flossi]|uniref:hypothetical protein n=1 Tax=Uniformispora flossi TaxID=3390723 RepID=UPI003C2DD572
MPGRTCRRHIGVRAYYSSYEAWIADDDGRPFIEHALGELAAHDAAMRDLAVAASR